MREKCEYGTFEKGTYLCRCIGLNLASDSTGTQVVSLWIWLSYMESSEKNVSHGLTKLRLSFALLEMEFRSYEIQ